MWIVSANVKAKVLRVWISVEHSLALIWTNNRIVSAVKNNKIFDAFDCWQKPCLHYLQ